MNSEINNSTTGENVVLASRIPPELKERVAQFAKATQRTPSKAVHYLLITHPELISEETLEQVS